MAITKETSRVGTDIRRRGWFIIFGLAAGHTVLHWVIQSFVVVLPEIQSTFQLNAVGVGGIALAIYAGIQRWRDGYTAARYYTIAWSTFLLGGVILAMNKFDLVSRKCGPDRFFEDRIGSRHQNASVLLLPLTRVSRTQGS